MPSIDLFSFTKFFVILLTHSTLVLSKTIFPLLMPDVTPTKPDTYFCTAFKMSPQHQYIIEFDPNATMNTAHHLLVFGCQVPGYHERDSPRAIWDCSEMATKLGSSEYLRRSPCQGPSEIVYAWARDAPKLILPKGVGFKVGGKTNIRFLVLQIHYADVRKFVNGLTDDSGVFLTMIDGDTKAINKRAGVLLVGTDGAIPAHSVVHMESACRISQRLRLHPFAFRTHTHQLGRVVTGYRKSPSGRWSLIGRRNPQLPQMFYPVADRQMTIDFGDVVAARCTMNNTLDHEVRVGTTTSDEMCNFYLMYYVDGDRILDKKFCFSQGPPDYYWKNDLIVGSVPDYIDEDASKLTSNLDNSEILM